MITRNFLFLVSLCLWEGLARGASASKILRRRGVGGSHVVKLGESRSMDSNVDSNAMPVVTLRNLISHEQTSDAGSFSYSKMLQNHPAPSVANKERQTFKPKREVDSVAPRTLAPNKELTQDGKKVKNNTKNADSAKTGRSEKTFTEERDRMEVKGSRSRSRRSWIWNQFFVIEEYAGPEPVLIGRLHTDMDRNDGRTKYVLRGEGAGSVFVIDEKTGNIHVTKPLDREEKDEYRLIATATDRQTDRALEPSSQFIIRVQDINDNPPVFDEGPYSATVPEMANIGTSIIQVTATDADDPTYGNSAKLVYTLVQGQQYFSVDPQTGILRTAVPDMDRETQDQYLVVLQAKDMGGHLGGLSGTTTVTVRLTDVNDNPPRFTQSMWSFSVSELAIPGAEIGRISATDADLGENAKLEYTILEGESGDTFNITGVNQEAVITLNKAVDYESRSSYSFSVEVLNPIVDPRFLRRGPFKDRASIRVAVLDADEPPRFSRARYHMDVSENCPPACTVGRVSAVDPDTGLTNNIRFSIDPQSDPEALFRITPETGLITTAMELDREREHWHNITVIATQRDNPSQVSRVLVAIETLDLNDNAPELDRQYNTAMCDSSSIGQVVQVLRAIDRDEGGNDSTVYFSIPPESSAALNFSVRDSGGPTASLVLLSQIQPLSRSPSSTLTLYVPLVLRDGTSGLTSTGTVTVSVCPCLKGGARAGEKDKDKQTEGEWDWEREAVCLPQQSTLPSPGLSTAALLAILACVATLLAVSALSLSLRRQKRDSLSPLEEDDVRENIITYDDEGGGEADTAAFDIAALQSAPHSSRSRGPAGPLYGRLCYSSHTLPILRRTPGGTFEPGLAELAYRFPGGQPDHSLVIQNQGAMVGPMESGAVYIAPTDLSTGSRTGSRTESRDGTAPQSGVSTSDGGTPRTISLTGTPSVYPEAPGFIGDWRDRVGMGGYVLGRRDMTPQLLPFPGQPRATYGSVMGFGANWVPGMEAARGGPGHGGPSLALRVGEFLRLRLAQVTFDPSQPPYDSVQVYGLEGTGSRAGSLSSLESEGEKDSEKEDWGAGLEEWGPQFQKLAQLFKDREKEREDKEKVDEGAKKEKEMNEEPEKKVKKDGVRAGEEGKD
uniref:Cadherin 24, type 2b n=1 Tax=Oreochromis niloticus TaxID=8128 RepID=A0A669CHG5_ORENI